MRKYIIIAISAIMAFYSCSKEEEAIVENSPRTFTGYIDNKASTKTTIEKDDTKYNMFWSSGDEISINGSIYTNISEDKASATFEGSGATMAGGYYKAYYPGGIYNAGTLTLPYTQDCGTYSAGVVSNLPMFAKSTTTELTFKHICGILAFKVNSGDISSLKSARISSKDKALSGVFDFTDENDEYKAVLTTPDDATKTLTLTFTTAFDPGANGSVIYAYIPAGTYNDIKIELSSDGTNYITEMKTAKKDITISRNTVYPFNFTRLYLPFFRNDTAVTEQF